MKQPRALRRGSNQAGERISWSGRVSRLGREFSHWVPERLWGAKEDYGRSDILLSEVPPATGFCRAASPISESLPREESGNVKDPFIVRVAPDRKLQSWKVLRDDEEEPRARGMSKSEAVKLATRLAEKKPRPALVLIHKTRYIVERALQF
jgi:hypothetical protein